MQAPAEVDEFANDDSSDYESLVSDTISVSSSVFDYTYENRRRYHAYRAGQYLLPNDEAEQERLDITHHIFSLCLDGDLCATKLENPQTILDVGTGTGIWAIEMGYMYPSARVTGIDLSPIQPLWVPPNVQFEIDDARQDWTFPKESIDFVHARTLAGSILDWPAFLNQAYMHLKPGGKIEIAEGRTNFFSDDGTFPDDSYTRQWLNEFHRLADLANLQFDVIPAIPRILEEASFEDVKTREHIVPVGTWPKSSKLKEIGRYFRVQFLEMALEAYTMALFTRNGWSLEETQVLMAHVREEMKSNKMHIYSYCSFVTATKPHRSASSDT